MDLVRTNKLFYSTFDLVKISVSFPFFFFFLNTTHSNLTSLLFYYKEIFPEMGEITNSKYEKKKLLKFPGSWFYSLHVQLIISVSLHLQTLNVEIRIFVLAEFPRKIYIYICMQTDFRNRIQISLLNKRATIIQMCTIHVKRWTRGRSSRGGFGRRK